MPVRDPRILELLDRDAIDTALVTYARGIDRHDVDLINAAYFPDAQDNHGPFRDTVSNGFAEWGNALHAGKTRAHLHNLTTRWVELQGDTALSDTAVLFALFLKDSDEVELGSGRYVDKLERRGGAWRIASRRTTIDMRVTADARVFLADTGGYLKGQWDRTDLSYQRPLMLDDAQRAALNLKGPAPPREDVATVYEWESTPQDPQAQLDAMVARRDLATCIVQSVRGLDRGERAIAGSAFSGGATIVCGSQTVPAADYIAKEIATAEAEDEAQVRHLTTQNVRLKGSEAVAETYVFEMRRRRGGGSVWAGGYRMLDRLAPEAGRWTISQRTLVADWEFESSKVSFNSGDRYLRSMRGTGDPLQLDARDQK